ncbi:hypothetical protein FIBSPDRAFT_1052611 [Athelia psychrophila]|uniref:Nephrocystin 3-like N-terminal domain-containing protein n=1 Tax=Athelia psychrophila TaxID=1759441 RepID=A0A165WYV7_9AGAM|nr:hypothetical protein FIBSPDRAFT_1052611 [Fibularhizoctonia sp. CBS 109695]
MSDQPTNNIVDLLRYDIYPRIDTRNGGALAKVSAGKTLIITGASEGIGRGIAIMHAHTHPQCIILTDRLAAPLDVVAFELATIDPEIRVIQASVDVSDYAAVGAFFAHLMQVENIGHIDVLFNTAGYLEQELSTCAKTISSYIIGVANVTNEFLRHNFAAAGGNPNGTTEHRNKEALEDTTVVITSSSSGPLDARPGLPAYSSSKILVNRFCEFLDVEYGLGSPFGAAGLRAFCFHPGDIPMDLPRHLPEGYLANRRAGGHDSDSPYLGGGFTAWLLTPEADFLRGRYASATWDVDSLLARKQDILEGDLLKFRYYSSENSNYTIVLFDDAAGMTFYREATNNGVQGVDELSWTSTLYSKFRTKLKPKLYIELYVDQKQVGRTNISQNNLWGETLTIPPAKESSEVLIRLKHKSSLTADPCFGVVEGTIGHLLSLCQGREVTQLKLKHGLKKSMYDAQGAISAGIKASESDPARQNLLRVAQEDLAPQHIDHDTALSVPEAFNQHIDHDAALSSNVDANVSSHEDLLKSLETIINKIQRIAAVTLDTVDALAKVHPYADAAWKVLSSVHKAYEHQKGAHGALEALLFKQMEELYSFVDDVENLPEKIKQIEHTLVRTLQQTTECGIFFREYTDHGFVGRFLGQAVSNRSQMISSLYTTLTQLNNDLKSGVQLRTSFMSSRTRDGVDRQVESDILKGLKVLDPAKMNAVDRPACLPGTRQDQQKEIIEWLMTPSDQNILWLHGAAGLGKSTLATTIAEYFKGLQRRGAFHFFDRNSPIESSPSRVICTLAYQLAEHDEVVRSGVAAAIERDPQIATAPLITQFKSLLCEPLSAASTRISGPIVIVIDALDECGDANSRQPLLDLSSSPDFAELPAQFRFIITSRPEHDIKEALHACEHVKTTDYSKASNRDMMLYIKHEIDKICAKRHHTENLPADWPGEKEIRRLVQHADGFFIWAATAMKLLFTVEAPVKWLANFLLHDRQVITLHDLYKTALLSVIEWKTGETTDIYRRILGIIIISQVPLTDIVITDLLGLGQDSGSACQTTLRRLGCIIQWSEGQSARILHQSFSDYLTDEGACASEPWFIDVNEHQRALTLACLRIMNEGLHFNMGDLKTSYFVNANVPNLSAHVEAVIPQSMSYSCQFWGHHLRQMIVGEPSIQGLLLRFFELKFLYWLEVLSLLGEVALASRALESIINQYHLANPSNKVYAFAQDGLKFVRAFAPTMTCSTPHIYLSCIPFAPRASLIKQQYTRTLPNTLMIESSMDENWPALQQVFEGHTGSVYSVAFSLDGQRIASGSQDGTVRIWDATTGTLVAGPFKLEGHPSHVLSMAFSPDGQHIVSGSEGKTIRILAAASGAIITGPFEGHTSTVNSVVFSPDGQRIASGSEDGTVQIWDAQTGAPTGGPFKRHMVTICSVAVSPEGRRIASGSEDGTVQIRHAKTGTLTGPFKGHTASVNSVVFSPDGQRIASGSHDGTVRIWDAKGGTLVPKLSKGHTDWVNSVVFSPDGQRIASGSADRTIRIWDARTGALIAGAFEGHTNSVRSVAFSPDGQRIVSGSDDKTVRIWDATTGPLIVGSFKGHTASVNTSSSSHQQHSDAHNGLGDHSLLENGWMLNSSSGLLFYVPHAHRAGLWWRQDTAVTSKKSTCLDLTRFAYGEDWVRCHI